MNANFLNFLRDETIGLTRDQLKAIEGGNLGAFSGSAANCGDRIVSCSGHTCTATDDVGCSCTNESGVVVSEESCIVARR